MIQHCYILLPCHSLEDFPVYHTGNDVDSILASWTALWHPAILGNTRQTPAWHRVDSPPEDSGNSLIVVPTIGVEQLPTGYAARVKNQGGVLVCGQNCRSAIIDQWSASPLAPALESVNAKKIPAERISQIADDFFALGYAYLQIQLMCRMLRYSTYLDDAQFQHLLLGAVDKSLGIVSEEANELNDNELKEKGHTSTEPRDAMAKCFDLLLEERNRFYPMDANLIDLTLVAPTTIGNSLQNHLHAFGQPFKTPTNLLICGGLLEQLSVEKPENLRHIKGALDAEGNNASVCIVSGQHRELPTQLLSLESIVSQISQANEAANKLLGQKYSVWARRRFGLANRIPGILRSFGFVGAVHATMDEGSFPEGSHPNIRWESADGQYVNSIGRAPISAESSDAFLKLGVTLGESLDSAHTAIMTFAHWPSKTCVWYRDLLRIASFGEVLGQFVSLDDCLATADDPGFSEEFTSDQYSTPFLDQYIERHVKNPVSRSIAYWQNEFRFRSLRALKVIQLCVDGSRFLRTNEHREIIEGRATAEKVRTKIDESIEDEGFAELESELNSAVDSAASAVTGILANSKLADANGEIGSAVVFNPFSFPRREFLSRGQISIDVYEDKTVFATDNSSDGGAILDLPAMGFVVLSKSNSKRKPKLKVELVDGLRLRNEFFEIQIDEKTGGIRQMLRYDARGNLFSQQLSMRNRAARQSRSGGGSTYAEMIADQVEITQSNSVLAEITATGSLIENSEAEKNGKRLAGFVQKTRVFRGIRVAEIEIEIDPEVLPKQDAWHSYYCSRFAWPNESATVYRSVNETKTAVVEQRFESPEYIEIDDAANRITILNGGIPFHRKVDYRKLDSILITAGETKRTFRFGIGFNVRNPKQSSSSFLSPPVVVHSATIADKAAGDKGTSENGFLFHLDNRNVVVTDWEPIWTADANEGSLRGVRARVLESQRKSGKLSIIGPRDFASCRKVRFDGQKESDGEVVNGKAVFDVEANEYFQVELYW